MFKNEYKDSFGTTYASDVYESAQKANHWSLAYTLLYALSKNGMKYATDTSGKCSVINKTSLGCVCQIVGKPTDTSGSLLIIFKRICLKINVSTSTDGKYAFPSGIFVTDVDGTTLGTLAKYNEMTTGATLTDESIPLYGPNCSWIYKWSNDVDTDEGKYSVQTATFKDAKSTFDCCSLHFWAENVYLGAVMFFKAKDYFSTKYKYGFGMFKANGNTAFKFSDGSDCSLHTVFDGVGSFTNKIAKCCFFTGENFAGLVGGINGIYRITDGVTTLSLFPENKVNINGRDFQAVAPGLFARTS